jgi:anti-anti-sigma factor
LPKDGLPGAPVPIGRTLASYSDGLGFDARVLEADGAVVVAVAGEIDMATADLFHRAINHACGHDGRVVVDLACTSFIDSSGLAVLIRASERLGQRSDALVVRAADATVRRTFEISGVDHLITMVPAAD